jgi:hypothetical protein
MIFKATQNDIGREVYPVDNSYSQDLTTGQTPNVNTNGAALAGDMRTAGLLTKIVYGPFKLQIHNCVGNDVIREFCIVEYNGRHFMVLNIFNTEQPIPEPFELL